MSSPVKLSGRQILASIRLRPPETTDPGPMQAFIKSAVRNLRKLPGAGRPFDPFICARGIGIQIRYTALSNGCSGRLIFGSGCPTVELNSLESPKRHRFTLAHELAHLCFLNDGCALPLERGMPKDVERAMQREERLCNRIASELLLPRTTFTRKARALLPSYDSLAALATDFGVSREVVLNRLMQLRVWSIGRLKLTRLSEGRYEPSRAFSHRPQKGWRSASYTSQSKRSLEYRLEVYFREVWQGPMRSIAQHVHTTPVHKSVSVSGLSSSAWATFSRGHIRLVVFV